MAETPEPHKDNVSRRQARDPRLDVFRGLGMFIILIAHVPNSSLSSWIPARFGFSDATEIFVFCSGAASALAFGAAFDHHGWWWGTRRIARRIWEVYRAHVGVFIAVIATLGLAEGLLPGADYLRDRMNLGPFLDAPGLMLAQFLRFAYVPNYFDILPMYIVILALVPVMMALGQRSPWLAAAFSLTLWLGATTHLIELNAEPWSERPWFFNPFAWQLVFFTGFAFTRGWLPAPPRRRGLLLLSLAFLAVSAPVSCHYGFSCYAGWGYAPILGDIHDWLDPVIDKPHFGALRYVHFLALAYVSFILAGERGSALHGSGWEKIAQVGRQTLAVFLSGIVLAQLLGVALDLIHFPGEEIVINLMGCAILYAVARFMTYWKASPPKDGRPRKGRTALGVGALVAALGATTSVQSGEMRRLMIPSAALGRELATSVYVPDAAGPWPVLYLLHGTNGGETDWPTMGHLAEAMDGAILRNELPPTLVVMPDGGNSWYVDNPDPGGSGLMARTLAKDLPQAIDQLFQTRACAQWRIIGGNSMGGYGALIEAMDHPDIYSAAFGMSSAIWKPWPDDPAARATRPTRMFRGAYGEPLDPQRFNDWNIFSRIEAYAAQPMRAAIKLAIGSHDFAHLKMGNSDFVAALAKRGVDAPLQVDEGGHEWSLWVRQLPEMLQWVGSRWAKAQAGPHC